jgi:putative transposase
LWTTSASGSKSSFSQESLSLSQWLRTTIKAGDRCHLYEVFLKINGRLHYLWWAVDQDGDVLDILVQNHRDKKAAKKFFRKLLKGLRYVPRVIITDKLTSYHAAIAEVLPGAEHLQQKSSTRTR